MNCRMFHAMLLIACAAQLCAGAASGGVSIEIPTPAEPQTRAEHLGYLKKLNEMAADASANAASNVRGDARRPNGQNILEGLGTYQSWVGDVDGAINTFDLVFAKRRLPRLPSISDAVIHGLQAEDAIKAIVAEAKNRRVVILNEAHHVPMHRAFSMKLARELRKIGFEYFAAETLTNNWPGLLKQGVTNMDGHYISEPVFGEFLRDVMRDGWKPVAYEGLPPADAVLSPSERSQYRETKQAQNLVDKVLKPHPSARLFIHVGYSHGDKLASRPAGMIIPMGAKLSELGNTEPLSIDQASFYSHPEPDMEWTPYRSIIAAKGITTPSMLKKADGTPFLFGVPPGAFDMQVVHPPYGVTGGRAEWLVSIAGRIPVDIPSSLVPGDKPRLIYAFYRDDKNRNAVPIDTVLLLPHQVPPRLMLPNGSFCLEYED